jgi:hypothetical protein
MMRMSHLTPYTAHMSDTADDWLTTTEAGWLLGVSRATMLRRLRDPAQRAKWGLVEGEDWRRKPMTDPPIYQMHRRAVERLLRGGDRP